MLPEEFEAFVDDVAEFFGKPPGAVRTKRRLLWYEQCHYVPGEALGWIRDRMFRELDRMPVNLPKVLRQGWAAWQEAHPQRIVSGEEDVECHAEGCVNGWIHVYREGADGREQSAVAMCDQCAVRRRLTTADSPHLDNADNLRAKGWRIKPPPVTLDDLLGQGKGFQRRVASAVKEVPLADAGADDAPLPPRQYIDPRRSGPESEAAA